LLAILTFSLSMLGTFLVRSGVLTSVHAFAVDPRRGLFILLLLSLYTGGALVIYALKAPALKSKAGFSPLSRESALIFNNLFMTTACATVLIGTLYPLIIDALSGQQISVGPPYFQATVIPIVLPAFLLMGLAPFVPWKKGEAKKIWPRLKIPLFVIATILLTLLFLRILPTIFPLSSSWIMENQTRGEGRPPGAWIGVGIALWLAIFTLAEFVQRTKLKIAGIKSLPLPAWGMSVAHLGIAVAIFGMVGTSIWVKEDITLMKPGDVLRIGRYEIELENVSGIFGPNYIADMATLQLKAHGRPIDTLTPERRYYPVAGQGTTEAAIRLSWRDDIYVALGEQDTEKPEYWVIRAYVHPLVPCLWGGFAMIALGGLLGFAGSKKPQMNTDCFLTTKDTKHH